MIPPTAPANGTRCPCAAMSDSRLEAGRLPGSSGRKVCESRECSLNPTCPCGCKPSSQGRQDTTTSSAYRDLSHNHSSQRAVESESKSLAPPARRHTQSVTREQPGFLFTPQRELSFHNPRKIFHHRAKQIHFHCFS